MNDTIKRVSGDLIGSFPQVRSNSMVGILASFLLLVAAPMVLVTLYFLLVAVPVYQTEASMAVRKEASLAEDTMGVSLGSSSALATYADSFIVAEYARSRRAVEGVMQEINLGELFSKGKFDPLYRYPAKASIEETVEYWKDMVDAEFDASTGILKLKVRAFSPNSALNIGNRLAQLLENLVAKLSEKSHKEAVRFAEVDLEKTRESLIKRRDAMLTFRASNDVVDPSSEVANLNVLITTLSQELIKLKTERAVLMITSKNSPKVNQLNIKIKNTLEIIREIKKGENDFKYVSKLPEQLRSYEHLKTNYEIANQQYVKALEQLSQANATAVLRQAHLYVIVPFSQPQSPVRPDLPLQLLKVLLLCFGVWGIYRLIV